MVNWAWTEKYLDVRERESVTEKEREREEATRVN
jgi:hypothetical protein